ncbi:MAG TPA: cupin domain-containing protein [Chitinophagaceae bacterium]
MIAEEIIKKLELKPHPEGGFYKEIYKSRDFIEPNCLDNKFNDKRRFSTSIYYLLQAGDFSAFHKIKSDEVWHYYAGGDIILHLLDQQKGYQTKILSNELTGNGSFQVIVPANVWFAAEPSKGSPFTLAGCTVSPGFDFNDFELAHKKQLLKQFPLHADLVNRFCK